MSTVTCPIHFGTLTIDKFNIEKPAVKLIRENMDAASPDQESILNNQSRGSPNLEWAVQVSNL